VTATNFDPTDPFFDPDDHDEGGGAGRSDVPSSAVVAQSIAGYVQGRLSAIHAASNKKVTATVTALGDAVAEVDAAHARYHVTSHQVRKAIEASTTVRALPPAPGGLPTDSHSRALGRFSMVAILVVCLFGDWLVDRGSLLVFRLAFGFTETLAALIAVVQTLSAHTVGRLLRRLKEAIDPDELSHERKKMVILIGLITTTVIALALVRAALGNLLLAALVLGVGGASALVAVTISYLHANTRLDAIEDTDKKVDKAGNKAADTGRDVRRAEARMVGAVSELEAVAGGVVAKIDLVYQHHGVHPVAGDEPAWIIKLRDWAAGHNLPINENN
jgi:hypothetical protein